MASVAENLSILQSVFAPAANSLAQYNSGRLALAQANLRRAQELQDQQTAAGLQRELSNAKIAADDRRTKMYIDRQELSNKAAFDRTVEAEKARQRLIDDQQKEAEAKATRAAVRKLYQEYSDAGGKKKLSEFGPEDSADTFYALQGEVGPLARKNSLDAFSGQARLLREQEKALRDSVSITKDEDSEIRSGALQALMADERAADGVEFYNNAVAKGRSPEAALDAMRKKYPGAGQALDALVSANRSMKIEEKMKAPGFKIDVEQIGRLRSDLAKRAWDEKLGPDSFGMLFDQPATPAATTAAPTGNVLGAFAPPKPSGVVAPVIAQAAGDPEYGSVLGFLAKTARALPDLGDMAQLGASYAAELPSGGLNYLAGGTKRYEEGLAEREAERERLMALINSRGRLNFNYRPLYGSQ